MKKKLMTLALLLAAASGWAQTDVTKKYVTNPSFENNGSTGWTVSNLQSQSNASFTKKQGTIYLEKWVAKGSAAGAGSVSQTLCNLEPGKYTLTVAAQNLDQNDLTRKCSGAVIFAGTKNTTVYTDDNYSVDFTYLTGDLGIGFRATNAQGNWIAVDNFRLYYNGAPDVADTKAVLTTELTTANKLYGDGTGKNADLLKAAIDVAQAVMDSEEVTAEEAVEAYKQLVQAVSDYRLSNVSEENPLDCTKYITNPSFEDSGAKGWTNESLVAQSNSSFTKKSGSVYMEKWVDKGKAVGDAHIYQTLTGLPNGTYLLTVAAQNLNQNSTSQKCKGAVIYADGVEEPVYTPKDYSLKFNSIAGSVKIGFRAEGATGNWLSVDNFRLYMIGEIGASDIVAEMQRIVEQAETLQSSMMSNEAASMLQSAIDAGRQITEESGESDVQSAKKALEDAMAAATLSISQYAALQTAIEQAESKYDSSKEGASEFEAALDEARNLAQDGNASAEALAAEILTLDKAALAFNLANATHSTTIKVTNTNHYVPTGATEILMRATMTGTALEKGICWSKEHEPTVLDERTTEHHTLNGDIYHARNMESATVYYVRPYIMSKTYEVVYGDEVKVVTHPKGTCRGTWNEGAPTPEANTRCRNAIQETIEYFNQWTGINGFTLTGNYGAQTPTADCSYGGWMRIGPNAGNQAIGTVIHETGHGVGVGTSSRWADKNVHDWIWKGREANTMFHFLENRYQNEDGNFMVGDGTHGWGQNATYDWFVNGADKDKHSELQYLGGCCLLYGLFVDGLCPTTAYTNGLPAYTYNFDDSKKYYLMCKSEDCGLGTGLLYQRTTSGVSWKPMLEDEELDEAAAWNMEYNAKTGYYRFKNASTGKYLSHDSGIKVKGSASNTENFQLMPDRTDVTISTESKKLNTHGYWFTWNASGNQAMQAKTLSATSGYGQVSSTGFDYADTATAQQWIIISEDEMQELRAHIVPTAIRDIVNDGNQKDKQKTIIGIYSPEGTLRSHKTSGLNIVRYSDGTSQKVMMK